MKVVLSHPTGNRNVRAIMSVLEERKMLVEFNTTFSFNQSAKWLRLIPSSLREECLRRSFPLPSNKVRTHSFHEFARLVLPKLGFINSVALKEGWVNIDAVYRNLDLNVAKRLEYLVDKHNVNSVYAYEDGAFATFKKAKELGLKCIYDLPIAYWETGRKLMMMEAERFPNWAVTLGGGIYDSTEKLERKTCELKLADVVVGPGKFVLDSLPSWASDKQIVMSPFGSPKIAKLDKWDDKDVDTNKPLRVLFAGSMGQRKGLADLFAAVRLLNCANIELIVLGSLLAPLDFYRRELPNFTYEAGRSHEHVLALMRSCDVFCLPSIVEGRALVMQEAMSQGLPIIITPNTGGADLIKEGETGFLVPICSPESIAEKLTWFLENRNEISKMGRLAQEHAAKYTWDSYGSKVINSLI